MSPPNPDAARNRDLYWNMAKALVVLLVLVVLIGVFFRGPLETAAAAFVTRFGLFGVFVSALILDTVPGLGSQPIVLLAYAGGLPAIWVWLAAGVGSWFSGLLGWAVGLGLGRWPWFRAWILRTGLEAGLLKHQWRGIFLAALVPFPYGLVTMAAGAGGLPLKHVAIGATGRFVKIGLSLAIVMLGLGATA